MSKDVSRVVHHVVRLVFCAVAAASLIGRLHGLYNTHNSHMLSNTSSAAFSNLSVSFVPSLLPSSFSTEFPVFNRLTTSSCVGDVAWRSTFHPQHSTSQQLSPRLHQHPCHSHCHPRVQNSDDLCSLADRPCTSSDVLGRVQITPTPSTTGLTSSFTSSRSFRRSCRAFRQRSSTRPRHHRS